MEAKDTVAKLALIGDGKCEWFEQLPEYEKRNLEHQAKVSFKAGVEKVVKWIEDIENWELDSLGNTDFDFVKWQAFKKESIKEGK